MLSEAVGIARIALKKVGVLSLSELYVRSGVGIHWTLCRHRNGYNFVCGESPSQKWHRCPGDYLLRHQGMTKDQPLTMSFLGKIANLGSHAGHEFRLLQGFCPVPGKLRSGCMSNKLLLRRRNSTKGDHVYTRSQHRKTRVRSLSNSMLSSPSIMQCIVFL